MRWMSAFMVTATTTFWMYVWVNQNMAFRYNIGMSSSTFRGCSLEGKHLSGGTTHFWIELSPKTSEHKVPCKEFETLQQKFIFKLQWSWNSKQGTFFLKGFVILQFKIVLRCHGNVSPQDYNPSVGRGKRQEEWFKTLEKGGKGFILFKSLKFEENNDKALGTNMKWDYGTTPISLRH